LKFIELKIPPPLIMLSVAGLMWLISPVWSSFELNETIKYALVLMFFLCGISIELSGLLSFRKAKTTINPLKPENSSQIVNFGIYQKTRNPMYLGMTLLLFGWAIFLSNFLAFALIPLFVVYITQFQIKPEEKILTEIFGDEFLQYKKQVRRWI
jgi:protein-S-isoprenylcysteine O-methyltransferase Ste14